MAEHLSSPGDYLPDWSNDCVHRKETIAMCKEKSECEEEPFAMGDIQRALVLSDFMSKERLGRRMERSLPGSRCQSLHSSPCRFGSRPCSPHLPPQGGEDSARAPSRYHVPPKQLLLYIVRMGSFTSTKKIPNEDEEDDELLGSWPAELTKEGLLEISRKATRFGPPLLKRVMMPVTSGDASQPHPFRVMQWNILAQALGTHRDNFILCPREALEWPFRGFRILEEILQRSPDILCLQEVDHYKFLEKSLSYLGYKGSFFPKPDSPCIYIEGNNGPDGCAIFFREDKFSLIEGSSRIIEVWKVQTNQVIILKILKHRESGKELCIATTHLKAKQGALLASLRNEEGLDILQFIKNKANGRPVIIAGDFNADPREPVHNTMLSDRLGLASAYAANTAEEPRYTTWKVRADAESKTTLDYVFYTKDHMDVLRYLDVATEDAVGENRLPGLHYPSDHLSLVCDFAFKPMVNGKGRL